MPTKITLHLGANKTGSSAIQSFLSQNFRQLRQKGIVVPNNELEVAENVQGYHVFGIQALLGEENGRSVLNDRIQKIEQAAGSSQSILISAENLAENPSAPALFTDLAQSHEIEAIIYIRRQDDVLMSSWQQWFSKVGDDFWGWVLSVLGSCGNWQQVLENWEAVVPREKINVRVFESGRMLGGDVVKDFCHQLGLGGNTDEFTMPQSKVNPTYSWALMDLVKGSDLFFKNVHDNEFYNFVAHATGDAFVSKPGESLITLEQRLAILKSYEKSNNWVKNRYLPDLSSALFTLPKAGDYQLLTPESVLNTKLQFLTAALYSQYKENKD